LLTNVANAPSGTAFSVVGVGGFAGFVGARGRVDVSATSINVPAAKILPVSAPTPMRNCLRVGKLTSRVQQPRERFGLAVEVSVPLDEAPTSRPHALPEGRLSKQPPQRGRPLIWRLRE
jgi:hypothetical protein